MKIVFLLLPLLGGCWYAQAQHTLSGRVSTVQNQPLDGAHIHIDQLHTATAPDGRYELHPVPEGQHRLTISYIGFKTVDTLLIIDNDVIVNISLKPEAVQLKEVVVRAAAPATQSGQRLRTQVIEKYSSASLGDALREVAGVTSLRTGSTIVKPVINGLHSSRVPIIANNVRLEDQQWGSEHAPNLDINNAGSIRVIKGAQALQYSGDAIGGLVLVEPLSVLKDTLFGKTLATFNSNGRGGTLTSSLHKGAGKGWAWNAIGTFKYLGDRQAPDYIISNSGNTEGNFSGDIKYSGDQYDITAYYSFYNATIGIAAASHIGNVEDLVRAINSGQPNIIKPFTYTIAAPRQEVQHHVGKINYNRQLANDGLLSFQYAFQQNLRKEFDLRRGAYEDVPALDLTLTTHSVQADWKQQRDKLTAKAGVSAALQDNTTSADTGIRPLIPDYTKTDAGAYAMISYALSEKATAEAGVRYDFSHINAKKYYQKTRWENLGYNGVYDHFITDDYGTQWLTNPQFTYHNISASAGITRTLGNSYTLAANAGLAVRNPNPSELFSDGLHHSNATIELGNLGIQKEKALKLSATLSKRAGNVTFEITPYLNRISDYIYLQPTGIEYTIRGSFPVYTYRQTNALLAGADVHLSWKPASSLMFTFTGAYIYGRDHGNSRPLPDMPPLNLRNTLRYSPSGQRDFYLELESESIITQSNFPDNNFYYPVFTDGALVPTLVDISTPPPGYSLIHIRTGINFRLFGLNSAATVSASNLFNTSYRDYLNRQRFYTDEPGRNVMLQLRINY
jgi:iron complex outermembrane receptor protein